MEIRKRNRKRNGFFGWFSRMFGNNPKRKGRQLTLIGLMAFNSPNDRLKFRMIKNELAEFLETNEKFSALLIKKFTYSIADKYELNPVLFSVFIGSLLDGMEELQGEKNLRLFVNGVYEALTIVF